MRGCLHGAGVYLGHNTRDYGNVFSFNIFGYVVVVLNSYETIKDAFQNPLLNDRPEVGTLEGYDLQPGKKWLPFLLHNKNTLLSSS